MPADAPHPTQDSRQPVVNHPPTRTVVLLHRLTDGSSHYDWLIEIPGRTDEHRLRSYRIDSNPSQWHSGQLFHGEQLPNHRAHYLSYEGPIGANRGSVERISTGMCHGFQADSDSELTLSIVWEVQGIEDGVFFCYRGQKKEDQLWELSRELGC